MSAFVCTSQARFLKSAFVSSITDQSQKEPEDEKRTIKISLEKTLVNPEKSASHAETHALGKETSDEECGGTPAACRSRLSATQTPDSICFRRGAATLPPRDHRAAWLGALPPPTSPLVTLRVSRSLKARSSDPPDADSSNLKSEAAANGVAGVSCA